MVAIADKCISNFDLMRFLALSGRWKDHSCFNSQSNLHGWGEGPCIEWHLPVADDHLPGKERSFHRLCQVPHECQAGEPSLLPRLIFSLFWTHISPSLVATPALSSLRVSMGTWLGEMSAWIKFSTWESCVLVSFTSTRYHRSFNVLLMLDWCMCICIHNVHMHGVMVTC